MIKIDSKPPIEVKLPEGAMNVSYTHEGVSFTFNNERIILIVKKAKPKK